MMGLIVIKDETLFGVVTQEQRLTIVKETLTLRDIITARVEEEVRKHNATISERYQYLIDLSPAEKRLNLGNKLKRKKSIDPQEPVLKAIEAFRANAFFVLVGNQQVDDLEEVIPASRELEVSFVKLTPLIGG
ncbi:hypothetical protein FUA23_19375 [Neolewinella aurantiaca]|uniref:Uncharacterized protein n=1 Tax=Neolewinella aurantiaca TaxID=2602767 RepID=A0A5C7FMX7_9BACT|nr:hypothetical protein [Neolewinella aurantiaca]TXF86666.1 hypothetical protein FUA23_19375 [Neolewinella aurantiaca]